MANKHAPIHPNHEIDSEAQKSLESFLKLPDWILRNDYPDYGIDYSVELGSERQPTGKRFLIQLKGKKRVRFKDGQASYRLKRQNAEYYAIKCEQPVILVLADTSTRECYYCFVQKWFDEHCPANTWGRKQTIAVKLKKEDNLSDTPKFSAIVKDALGYMREKFPSSIPGAIKGRINQLRQIDSGWHYEICTSKSGQETVSITPAKDNQKFTISLEGEQKIKGFQEALKTGKPFSIELEQGDRIKGAPIFEHLFATNKQGTLRMASSHQKNAEIRLSVPNNNSGIYLCLLGKAYAGNGGLTVQATFHGIVSIELFFAKENFGKKRPFAVNLSLNWEHWWGHPVLLLPYFEDMKAFISILCQSINIELNLIIEGASITRGVLDVSSLTSDKELFLRCNGFLDFLEEVRYVSSHLKISPILTTSNPILDDEYDNWLTAALLIREGRFEHSAGGVTIEGKGKLSPETVEKFNSSNEGEPLRIDGIAYEFESMGVKVCISPVRYTYASAILRLVPNDCGHSFSFSGVEGSVFTCEYMRDD